MRHPMQKIEYVDGVIRFRANPIVRFLYDWAAERGMGMNELIVKDKFSCQDWEQFAQLIGYSVSGWGDLSYVSKKALRKADAKADKLYQRKLKKEDQS